MATISITTPSDGQTIDASDVATPLNTIVSEINGSLDSDNIASGGVVPNNLTSGTGTSWAWQSWTPTLTNLSGGTIDYAKYVQIGKTVHYTFRYTLGGAGVSGTPSYTLPVTAVDNSGHVLGIARMTDNGGNTYYGASILSNTTTAGLVIWNASSTYLLHGGISSTIPFTWGSSDYFVFTGTYEAA